MNEGEKANFSPHQTEHRRGNFPALAVGISYGNGQLQPSALKDGVTGVHAEMLQRLVGHAAVQRMAAFASGTSWCSYIGGGLLTMDCRQPPLRFGPLESMITTKNDSRPCTRPSHTSNATSLALCFHAQRSTSVRTSAHLSIEMFSIVLSDGVLSKQRASSTPRKVVTSSSGTPNSLSSFLRGQRF